MLSVDKSLLKLVSYDMFQSHIHHHACCMDDQLASGDPIALIAYLVEMPMFRHPRRRSSMTNIGWRGFDNLNDLAYPSSQNLALVLSTGRTPALASSTNRGSCLPLLSQIDICSICRIKAPSAQVGRLLSQRPRAQFSGPNLLQSYKQCVDFDTLCRLPIPLQEPKIITLFSNLLICLQEIPCNLLHLCTCPSSIPRPSL